MTQVAVMKRKETLSGENGKKWKLEIGKEVKKMQQAAK